jgi:hypothetical protein
MSTQPPPGPPEGWEPRPQGEGSERPTEPQWPSQGPQWGTQPPQPPQPPEGWGPPPQPQWGQQPPQPPPRGRRLSAFLTVVVALVGILIVAGIIGALAGDPESTSSPQATASPTVATTQAPSTTVEEPATTAEPETTAKPTTTAKPKPIPSKTILRNAVVEALGESNRNVKRLPQFGATEGEYIALTWRINENLTEGLTKSGARLDGVNILKAIRGVPEHDRYKGVVLKGTYPLVDQLGNSSEETVIRATYERRTLERINFDGIDYKKIFDIADSGSTHPAFQY